MGHRALHDSARLLVRRLQVKQIGFRFAQPDLPLSRFGEKSFRWKVFAAFVSCKAFFQPNSLAMRPSAPSRLDIAVAKESLI